MNIYKVGGCVRDQLLGINPKDIDYVVVGSNEEEMLKNGFEQVGKDFPVFLKNGEEYALARTEKKVGLGYSGFITNTKNVSLEEDLYRRDLTINAMALDINNNLIDPYGGKNDINNKILKHVSEHFSEDPVRVLRIARFSARYNFTIHSSTYKLMKDMVSNGEINNLTKERVWKEIEKTLTEPYLKNFFNALISINALSIIFDIDKINLKNIKINNSFEENLCYIFSQIPINSLKSWKMPEEFKKLITDYSIYSNKKYKNLTIIEKINYINKTNARHSNDYALKLLNLCNDNESKDVFIKDINSIKNINYQEIIELSNKKEIQKNILEAQKKVLENIIIDKFIYHGSENSLDVDAYMILDNPIDLNQAKLLYKKYPELNLNFINILDGKVSWTLKGTIDEVNNSILSTYNLHKQDIDNPILNKVNRQYLLKTNRTIRGLLTHFTKTIYRNDVKKALYSNDLLFRLDVLSKLDILKVDDFIKKNKIETYKFIAFQLGQTLSLIEDNVELFTKNDIVKKYPELGEYINREKNVNPEKLQKFLNRFVLLLKDEIHKTNSENLYSSNFNNCKEVIDIINEKTLKPIVIFDIDGTLFDETHRKKYRDEKDWNTYFSLSKLDIPINEIIQLTHSYRENDYEIWLFSGRNEVMLEDTLFMLNKYDIKYDFIKLRKDGNNIPDYLLKPGWTKRVLEKERIVAIYDNDKDVIDNYKKLNLNVIDVNLLLNKSKICYNKK